jgi:hypothetical protein
MAPPKKPVPVAVLQRSAAGEYTPEKLAELRKNSKTIYFSSTVRSNDYSHAPHFKDCALITCVVCCVCVRVV